MKRKKKIPLGIYNQLQISNVIYYNKITEEIIIKYMQELCKN